MTSSRRAKLQLEASLKIGAPNVGGQSFNIVTLQAHAALVVQDRERRRPERDDGPNGKEWREQLESFEQDSAEGQIREQIRQEVRDTGNGEGVADSGRDQPK